LKSDPADPVKCCDTDTASDVILYLIVGFIYEVLLMIPNNVIIRSTGVTFYLSWTGPINAVGYLVLAGRDTECVVDRRCFFVPSMGAEGMSLDMGGGIWFFRIASILAGDGRGSIKWSNIHGPCVNAAAVTKAAPPLESEPFSILHTRPIQGGLRAYVNYDGAGYIMIMEASRTSSLPNSDTEWSYQIDSVRRGSVEISGLVHPHTYYCRGSLLLLPSLSSLEGTVFPTDRIIPLGSGVRFNATPEKPIRPIDVGAQSAHRGDVAVLRQTENVANIRFSSHADYLRYQAARARTGTGK
jgi:hypothetical protein